MLLGSLRWKLGNGKCIKVWKDAWLDGGGTCRLISSCRESCEYTIVDFFVDLDCHIWKEDLVQSYFLPFYVDRILRIPISLKGDSDEICWVHAKDGILMVKDVYCRAMSPVGDASCSNAQILFGKRFGGLIFLAPKVREFFWRACWDIIPHGANL